MIGKSSGKSPLKRLHSVAESEKTTSFEGADFNQNSSTTCSTASFIEIFVPTEPRRSGYIAKFTLLGETLTQLRSVTDLMVIG